MVKKTVNFTITPPQPYLQPFPDPGQIGCKCKETFLFSAQSGFLEEAISRDLFLHKCVCVTTVLGFCKGTAS